MPIARLAPEPSLHPGSGFNPNPDPNSNPDPNPSPGPSPCTHPLPLDSMARVSTHFIKQRASRGLLGMMKAMCRLEGGAGLFRGVVGSCRVVLPVRMRQRGTAAVAYPFRMPCPPEVATSGLHLTG